MKKKTLLLLFFCCLLAKAQNELSTSKGIVHFEASVPLFEEVKAINSNVSCLITLNTNEINCTVYIQQFQFKKELMQKHFNDYYLESDRYPKASFIGRIEKLDYKSLSKKPMEYQLKGIIRIHGRSKPLFGSIWINKINNGLEMKTSFNLHTDDFKIEIPTIIASKISKQVNTTIHASLLE